MKQALGLVKIRRALISVSDKSELKKLSETLAKFKVEIVATGGTLKELQEWKIKTTAVSQITGFPEILDGRVKTLHPKIFGGILAVRNDKRQRKELKAQKIPLFDLVVVNLYPFEETVQKKNITQTEILEQIDIGGPALIRAAAKNFKSVAILTNPNQYSEIIQELQQNQASLNLNTRLKLACEAFSYVSHYDTIIEKYFSQTLDKKEEFPEYLNLSYKREKPLRYGENPHQKAFVYHASFFKGTSLLKCKILSGKELSYNNLVDLEAALEFIADFEEPFAVIIKHTNPTGVACGETLAKAYEDALASDPLSAYGGIVGLNQKVDYQTARKINATTFVECILAPEYDKRSLQLLRTKKNRRILAYGKLLDLPKEMQVRPIGGGALVQTPDMIPNNEKYWTVVTETKPSSVQMKALKFAWKVCKHVKSNAIVIAHGKKTVGIGEGQTSRVDSVIKAIRKAEYRADGSVLASDAFFPMSDSVEETAKAGIVAIIQPGGSKYDQEVIATANKYKIAMVFTGVRHFKH